jgi:hypothetical protein
VPDSESSAFKPGELLCSQEIARAVRRQVYDENQHGADAALALLLTEGFIEKKRGALPHEAIEFLR